MPRSWVASLILLAATVAVPRLGVAQQPKPPEGPLTLLQAIALGRSQGVSAAIARLDERAAQARARRAGRWPH